jgi:multicomponent Na+:H+ antiporter subunit A
MTRRLFILDVVLDVVVRTALVFSFFLLFSGHNAPGGGFIAGLVAGICLILRYIARGEEAMVALVRARPDQLIGFGLLLAVAAGAGGWIWGSGFLESEKFAIELPVLGVVKTTSALVFDIGVYSVVLGLAAALVAALGDDKEPDQ